MKFSENSENKKLILPKYKKEFTNAESRVKELNKLLYTFYDEGYLAAEYQNIKESGDTLFAELIPGKIHRWARLSAGNIDADIVSKSVYRDKFFYHEAVHFKKVSSVIKNILSEYENNGYPFASIHLDSLKSDNNELSASLKVDKYLLISVDSIIINGKAKITEAYLYNYLGIRPGDLYDESKFRNISSRLKELPFITEEKPAIAQFYGDKVKLNLYLKHRNASSFSGIIGFMPNNAQSGKLLITGDVQLKLLSVLGYGEQLDLSWRRLNVQTQSLNVYAKYPFLFRTKLGVDGNFELYRKDSTFQNIGYGAGLQYVMSGTDYIKVFYKRFNSRLIDRTQFASATKLPDFADATVNYIGLSALRERLNYRLNPLKGYSLFFSALGGSKEIRVIPELPQTLYNGLNLKSLQIAFALNADYYIKLMKRMTLKLGTQTYYMYNPSLFRNELQRIGGIKNLRGFDEESMFVSSYSIGLVEVRYLLEQNSFVSLFFNGGFTEQRLYNSYQRDTPYGVGAGINFFTKAGIISLNYALGSQQGRPLEFKTAKIHIGFAGLF